MGQWKCKVFKKQRQGKQENGSNKRADTCQLSSVGGLPRKFWIRSRSYKHKNYSAWNDFTNEVNK